MSGKISLYIIIFLLTVIIGGYFWMDYRNNELEKANLILLEEKKTELKKVRDSAHAKIDNIIKLSNKSFDSIVNLPPKIKWMPYEKPVYPDRDLNEALDIHQEYKSKNDSLP